MIVRIDGGGAQLNQQQREFNRLSALVERLRKELDEWQQLAQRTEARLAESQPRLLAEDERIDRELVAVIETLLVQPQKPALTKRERQVLTRKLLELLTGLIDAHPQEQSLIQLYDLHGVPCWADVLAEREEDARAELDFAEALAAEAFGADVIRDHGGSSVEELFDTVSERITAQWEADAAARESARRGRRQGRRATRQQAEQAERSQNLRQSVREVYRQLAGALHPDRESDPDQRERKTALMQRINQAYADNDLLKLLALQMEVEQLDEEALATLPAQRVAHFIAVLNEHVRTLRADLQLWVEEFRRRSGQSRLRAVRDFERSLERELASRRAEQQALAKLAAQLRQPPLRKAVVEQFAAQFQAEDRFEREQADIAELEFEAMFAFARQQMGESPRRRRRR